MHILVASSSAFRHGMYRDAVESLGHTVSVASGGVECVEHLRMQRPDVLLLEAPLFWGGADGVLQTLQGAENAGELPVILVATGVGPIDWFRISRFRIANLLFRLPTAQELSQAILGVVGSASSNGHHRPLNQQETTVAQ